MEQKKKNGFASMDPERVRELARRGGKAAHEKGVGYRFTSEKAREAGMKGVAARRAKKEAAQS